jgi:hypothetical protein
LLNQIDSTERCSSLTNAVVLGTKWLGCDLLLVALEPLNDHLKMGNATSKKLHILATAQRLPCVIRRIKSSITSYEDCIVCLFDCPSGTTYQAEYSASPPLHLNTVSHPGSTYMLSRDLRYSDSMHSLSPPSSTQTASSY